MRFIVINHSTIKTSLHGLKSILDSIKGMSINCEFINEERTEMLDHVETGIEDGIPIFENAPMIDVFQRGYIILKHGSQVLRLSLLYLLELERANYWGLGGWILT